MVKVVCSVATSMVARSMIRVLLITAVVGGAFPKHASADTISFTASFGPTASPFDMAYVFAGFDPTLGTLNRVLLHADESLTTTGSITNQSEYTDLWRVTLDGSIRALFTNSAGSTGIGTPPVPPTRTVTIPSIAPDATYLVSVSTADVNDVGLAASTILGGGTVAEFFQAGPITANLHADGGAHISVPSGVTYSSSLTTSISGSFSVVYDYTPTPTPVPEPASVQMLGIGLAGLIGITQRTRRRLRPTKKLSD